MWKNVEQGMALQSTLSKKKSQNEEHDPNVKDNLEEISWNNHPRGKK